MQLYYSLRAKQTGTYLSARPPQGKDTERFLLVFSADYDALTYLNAHAPDVQDRFAVETLAAAALKQVLQRWGFRGMGMVTDPRLPTVDFFVSS